MIKRLEQSVSFHEPLGLDAEILRQFSALETMASQMKAALIPQGLTTLLEQMESQRRLIEPLISPSAFEASQAELRKLHDAAAVLKSAVIEPNQSVMNMLRDMNLGMERRNANFTFTSDAARSWANARSQLEKSCGLSSDILKSFASLSESLRDLHQPLASRMIESIIDAKSSHDLNGIGSSLRASLPQLDVSGLLGLTERVRSLADESQPTESRFAVQEEIELENDELQEVRDSLDALKSAFESRFDSLEARIEKTNEAILRIQRMMHKPWGTKVALILVHIVWSLVQNVAANCIYDYLKSDNQSSYIVTSQSARPADVVRAARRSAFITNVAPEIIRTLRIVKRRSVPVFCDQSDSSVPIAQLQLGTVVEVIESAGKWRCVRWSNDDQRTTNQGWVRAKYLGKLTRE